MARTSRSASTPFDAYASGVLARVRTGRAERAGVRMSEPFDAQLYLTRNAQGHTCSVALQDQDFAEFDPRHHLEHAESGALLLVAEDYYLEILALAGHPPAQLER